MRLLLALACVTAVLVVSSPIAAAQNVLLVGNTGSFATFEFQEDSLVAINAFIADNYPMATTTMMATEADCSFFETFDTTTYDIIFYMKFTDWGPCAAAAEPRIEAFANAGGVFVFAGTVLPALPTVGADIPFLNWFGTDDGGTRTGEWSVLEPAPAGCPFLTEGATSMPIGTFVTIEDPTTKCALVQLMAVWALNANVVGSGVIAMLADEKDASLFNNDPSHNSVLVNLMTLAATNGGVTDPHIFSRPIFGSHTRSHELVSLLAAHSLGTRDSLLASPTWVQVAVSDEVEVSCLLGGGLRGDGTYFTGLRIDAGGDSLRLASVAEGDDLLLGVEDSNDVMNMCARGSEEQLEYELAGGLAHVTVTCDMAEAREKLEGDAFMMGHVGWTKGRTQARAEVRTADYLVVAYYVQQNYSANIARWRGEPTGFFNVEAQPLPGGVFGGLFGNSLEAGMQEMRAVASTPSEAEARLVASFLRQE